MFLKAVYVNGWTIKTKKEKVKNMNDFIDLLRSISGKTASIDFELDTIAEEDIYSTFNMLRTYVSSGQIEDMVGQLPKQLKKLFYDYSF
jgi:uncharacterized protein (DUF2267 family)